MRVNVSLASSIASLPQEQREALLAELSDEDLAELEWDWRFWARPNQIAPEGDWLTWVALAGRGFGKTEAGAQWVKEREAAGARQIALVAETQKDLEEVMVPRLLSIYPPGLAPTVRFKPVRIRWPSGATALGYNGTEPNQLRGPEFDTAWVDELAKYRYARETWDMLQFTLRAGDDPKSFVTTTPRPIPVLREILADPKTVVSRGSTFENAGNLPKQFLDKVRTRYAGTRLGRQELNAEMLDDLPGALWTRNSFDPPAETGFVGRIREEDLPQMVRVVIAIDPSGTKGESDPMKTAGDDIGIIAAGLGIDNRGYLLGDWSCNLSPDGWGRRAVEAYSFYGADRIVAEINFGGAMVESVIRSIDKNVSYKTVTASRGKVARAEPVASLYEQGRVSHVGDMGEVEDQMCLTGPTGYAGEGSPDRMDAAVWALTELMIEPDDPLVFSDALKKRARTRGRR